MSLYGAHSLMVIAIAISISISISITGLFGLELCEDGADYMGVDVLEAVEGRFDTAYGNRFGLDDEYATFHSTRQEGASARPRMGGESITT